MLIEFSGSCLLESHAILKVYSMFVFIIVLSWTGPVETSVIVLLVITEHYCSVCVHQSIYIYIYIHVYIYIVKLLLEKLPYTLFLFDIY